MNHYSRQLHYYNILLNESVAEPQTQDGGLSVQVPVSQSTQPIEVPCEPEATQPVMPAFLGVGAKPKVPKEQSQLICQTGK